MGLVRYTLSLINRFFCSRISPVWILIFRGLCRCSSSTTCSHLQIIYIEVNVIEVGHDFTMQLKKWFDEKGIKNSFDTWHGKICSFLLEIFSCICLFVMLYKMSNFQGQNMSKRLFQKQPKVLNDKRVLHGLMNFLIKVK